MLHRSILSSALADLGPRPAGSPGSVNARKLVAAALEATAAVVREQPFGFVSHAPAGARLTVGGESWEVAPALHSASTPDGGVEGELRALGRQIAIPGLLEAAAFGIFRGDREVGRLLVNPYGRAATFPTGYGPTLTQATGWISDADGKRIAGHLGAPATLEIAGEFVTARDANVIGALAGSSSGAVLLTSHHDSVWNGSGAIDNATGVEAVVRVLESCADRVGAVGLTGIAFAAEELGLLGSRFAVAEAQVRGELDEVVAVVNFDSLGHGDQLLVQSTPGAMRRLVESAFEEVDFPPTVSPVHEDPGPGSDHLPYALQGVPVLALMQFPYPEYHRPEESPDLVDDAAFQAGLSGATKVVEALLDGFDPGAEDRDG